MKDRMWEMTMRTEHIDYRLMNSHITYIVQRMELKVRCAVKLTIRGNDYFEELKRGYKCEQWIPEPEETT